MQRNKARFIFYKLLLHSLAMKRAETPPEHPR